MTIHRSCRVALVAISLGLPIFATGCDYDTHPTATGKPVQAPETTSVEDPGKVNAGGPGAEGKLPK